MRITPTWIESAYEKGNANECMDGCGCPYCGRDMFGL